MGKFELVIFFFAGGRGGGVIGQTYPVRALIFSEFEFDRGNLFIYGFTLLHQRGT